jgi:parallel beta-helix repeat protein
MVDNKKKTSLYLFFMFLCVLLIITLLIHQTKNVSFGQTNNEVDNNDKISNDPSQNINRLPNETLLITPTEEMIAEAIANKIPLYSYLTANDTDLLIKDGNWTMEQLHQKYPQIIQSLIQDNKVQQNSFLIKKKIFVDKDAVLNIVDTNVFLESLSNKDNDPTSIVTQGKSNIFNSTVKSWDYQNNSPDYNPYHPRAFIAAIDGGKMDIYNSTISDMGFSQGGVNTLESSLAAINYYNTSNFFITNSTISHNLYGFYSKNSSNFKITGNDIYDHIGYGLDPHEGSKDFLVDSNHIRFVLFDVSMQQ